jgi:hypothetical protein
MLPFAGLSPLCLRINLVFLRLRTLLRTIAIWVPFWEGKYFVLHGWDREQSPAFDHRDIIISLVEYWEGNGSGFAYKISLLSEFPRYPLRVIGRLPTRKSSFPTRRILSLLINVSIWTEVEIPRWSHTLFSPVRDFDHESTFCILSELLRLDNDETCPTLLQEFNFASQAQLALAGMNFS